MVVSQSEPGLRDYRKRLSNLTSKDPFKQRAAGVQESTTTTTTSGESSGETPAEGSGENQAARARAKRLQRPTETTPSNPHITFYSFAMDVRVTPCPLKGKPSKAKPEVRRDLPELTMLPSRQTPAIVFMGVTKDSHKALMLISSNVKAIFGDNVCAVGGETCELLAMEPGVPENFVYGGNEKIYRIELIDLNLVRSDRVNKAPLGKSHKEGEIARGLSQRSLSPGPVPGSSQQSWKGLRSARLSSRRWLRRPSGSASTSTEARRGCVIDADVDELPAATP